MKKYEISKDFPDEGVRSGTLLDLVKELNALCERDLLARVVSSSDVQWCLGELQDILEAENGTIMNGGDTKNG